jgi:hypothetical protein
MDNFDLRKYLTENKLLKEEEEVNEILGTILGAGALAVLGHQAYKKWKNFKKDKNIQPIGGEEGTEVVEKDGKKFVLTKYKDTRDGKEYVGLEVMEGGATADVGHRQINTLLFTIDKMDKLKDYISKGGGLGGGPTDLEGGRGYDYDRYFGPYKSDEKISRGSI